MENWLLKRSKLGDHWIGVKWIQVAVESIPECLLRECFFLDSCKGLALGDDEFLLGVFSFEAEAAEF
jgi:hypothetical protein